MRIYDGAVDTDILAQEDSLVDCPDAITLRIYSTALDEEQLAVLASNLLADVTHNSDYRRSVDYSCVAIIYGRCCSNTVLESKETEIVKINLT